MTECIDEIPHRDACAKRRGARFLRDARGTAAIEMGIVAGPFLLLIAAILEYSYGNYVQSSLDVVARSTARAIMTGAVQTQTVEGQPLDAAQFKSTVICSTLPAILSCNDLYVDVQAFDPPPGGQAPTTTPYENFVNGAKSGVTAPALDGAQNAYCVGGPRKLVILRLAYTAPILTTSVVFPNAITHNGRKVRLLTSMATFKNEPFPTSQVNC